MQILVLKGKLELYSLWDNSQLLSGIPVWLFHTIFHDKRFHRSKIVHCQHFLILGIESVILEIYHAQGQGDLRQRPVLHVCTVSFFSGWSEDFFARSGFIVWADSDNSRFRYCSMRIMRSLL